MTTRERRSIWILGAALLVCSAFSFFLHWPDGHDPLYRFASMDAWLTDLASESSRDRDKAAAALRSAGTNCLPRLLATLQRADSPGREKFAELASGLQFIRPNFTSAYERQRQAAIAFNELGRLAKPAIPELIRQMRRSPFPETAATALAGVGPEAVPLLIGELSNPDAAVRQRAARTLGAIGETMNGTSCLPFRFDASRMATLETAIAAAMPALFKTLSDPDWRVHCMAVHALGRIRREPARTAAALADLLEAPHAALLNAVSCALTEFGADARAAAPALLRALEAQTGQTGDTAVRALLKIDPARTTNSIAYHCWRVGRAGVWDEHARTESAIFLGLQGTNARCAVIALTQGATNRSPSFRLAAIQALTRIGEVSTNLLPDLVKDLSRPDPDLRAVSLRAIVQMRHTNNFELASDSVIVQVLLGFLEDADHDVWIAVVNALAEFGPAAKAAVPELLKRVSQGPYSLAKPAFEALERMDPDALTAAGFK
jgi:HEAT repeat protein